jgi:DNA-binding PadR family transcriptional regulator
LALSDESRPLDLELAVKGIRGVFRDIVLYAIYKLGEAHGYAIKNYVNSLLGAYTPSSGILYPTLRELEKQGLAASTWRERRRVYVLTEKGRVYISSRLGQIESLIDKVKKAVKIATSIGLFHLLAVIRELWERNVEIPLEVLEAVKVKIEEITSILSSLLQESY